MEQKTGKSPGLSEFEMSHSTMHRSLLSKIKLNRMMKIVQKENKYAFLILSHYIV